MRPRRDYSDEQPPRRNKLYRNSQDGMIAGVCAGVADYFGFDLTLTRVIVGVGSLFFWPTFVSAYVLLAILLEKRPPGDRVGPRTSREEELERKVRAEPHATLHTVRHRFRELDLRMQKLEKYVTSDRFKLDQEFEGLQR
jgi:phage shock protein C